MQDVVAFSAFTRTDMVFAMLIRPRHIFQISHRRPTQLRNHLRSVYAVCFD